MPSFDDAYRGILKSAIENYEAEASICMGEFQLASSLYMGRIRGMLLHATTKEEKEFIKEVASISELYVGGR
jgi:hypothetical protein